MCLGATEQMNELLQEGEKEAIYCSSGLQDVGYRFSV